MNTQVVLAAASREVSNLTISLIALGGALVGGLLTGGAQVLAEWMRHRRERDATDAAVRGVGRVVDYFLSMWEILLEEGHEKGRWWNAKLEPMPDWTGNDLQLVAASCDETTWTQIRVALVMARTASSMRATAGDDPDLEISEITSDSNRTTYQGMRQAIGDGRTAMRRGLL
jgi:hypothetical protein